MTEGCLSSLSSPWSSPSRVINRNSEAGVREGEDEMDLRSFDERGLLWKKLSKHKRLPVPVVISHRLGKHSHRHCHTLALSYEPKLVSWQISCTTPHACLFLFSGNLADQLQWLQHPASILISRDVGSDKRRKKISKMSSLMSNTLCELPLFSPPPLVWLLSSAVTLAVFLGATPCQVEFRDSDTVSSNPSTGWARATEKHQDRRTATVRETSWKRRGDWSWQSGAAVVSCDRLLPRRPDLKVFTAV